MSECFNDKRILRPRYAIIHKLSTQQAVIERDMKELQRKLSNLEGQCDKLKKGDNKVRLISLRVLNSQLLTQSQVKDLTANMNALQKKYDQLMKDNEQGDYAYTVNEW